MIIIIKGRQRQRKTTTAVGICVELILNWGYAISDIISNIHLFKPLPLVNPEVFDTDKFTPSLWHPELVNPDIIEGIMNHCYRNHVAELKEYHYLDNKNMIQYIKAMVTHGLKHKIILVDEIDRVFPHRFWQDREQVEALLGLWQDEKLFNWLIGTAHLGLSIDKIIRESMQIEVISEKGLKDKSVNISVFNALDMDIFDDVMENVELVQRLFYSWEPVR